MTLTELTAMNPVAIVQSDTTVYDPPLKFLLIGAAEGTVKVQAENGNVVTITVPSVANGGRVPFIVPGRIRKVFDSDTSLADAALVGWR